MKYLLLLLLAFTFSACQEDIDLKRINGYWEIKNVTNPDGEKKEYSISTIVDYIEITEDTKGFRKKLQPRLDGTYKTNKTKDDFEVILDNGTLKLHYTTPLAQWTETILKLNKTQLHTKNDNGHVYQYERFEKFDILK